jgi:hypothetical protein
MVFWGIDPYGKDYLYQWQFLPFSLKNARKKIQIKCWQTLVSPNVRSMTSLFLPNSPKSHATSV